MIDTGKYPEVPKIDIGEEPMVSTGQPLPEWAATHEVVMFDNVAIGSTFFLIKNSSGIFCASTGIQGDLIPHRRLNADYASGETGDLQLYPTHPVLVLRA